MSRKKRAKPTKRPKTASHARRATETFAAGEFAAAATHCRRALDADSSADGIWHLLAASLLAAGDLKAALEASSECCRLAPDVQDYHNTHALVLEQQHKFDAAERIWRELCQTDPLHADALYNLGKLLLGRGDHDAAVACFERALKLRPAWADAAKTLGCGHFSAGNKAAAEAAFNHALGLAPQDAEICLNLARLRQDADDFDGAMIFYRMALERKVDGAVLLRFAMLCPIFCADAEAVRTNRGRVMDNLLALDTQPLTLNQPATALANPAFYFAYHGVNDRELMTRFGNIIERAWHPSPLPVLTRPSPRRRIVFVSAFFKQHTVGRLYAPLIERLPRDDFDLTVLNVGAHDDAMAQRIAAAADTAVCVAANHASARLALHELDADIIFYTDIGMDPTTFWLAAERLAPVQSVGWGHPVTTGLATMDYFVSSSLLEPDGAAAHYCETLMQFPAWPGLYDDPGTPLAAQYTRADFGFADGEHVYLCPQSLFKLHPDFDAYLAAILRQDDSAVVTLIESRAPWRRRLETRFGTRLGRLAERIRFIPTQSSAAYHALLAAADVVLDTIHFSGGFTSFETLWVETPVVTERDAFMRGRVTAGLYDLLGIESAITSGADEYAECALELAHNGAARRAFTEALGDRKRRLLDLDASVLPAYVDFFSSTLACILHE